MKVVIQRVSQAQVAIEEADSGTNQTRLHGAGGHSSRRHARRCGYVVGKISKLRVFEDDEGK